MERYKTITSDIHFVNASCDTFDGLKNSDKYNTESNDPLQGLGSEIKPKFYRVNSEVFAEPFETISDGLKSHKSGTINPETHQDKIFVVDNVIVQQRTGKKYKKYHINFEDPSSLSCPQPNCNRSFSLTKLLKAHIRKVHCADKNRCICEVCGDKFSSQYLLVRHSAVHNGRTVKCPVCDKVLSERTSLSVHLRTHSGVRPHACSVCAKSFLRKSTLNNHVKFVHRDSQLQCPKCQERFETRSQWTRHLTSHRANKADGVPS
ncbi:unnamed protein product [Arctia plantaginis]|uniref:C2H2-type domain-containing protein n=1 Tax=Arctia plantaginis TaxID=874455 RepID=A0A8S0ZIP6_ARCPL|nr:unnamed protein product [Arctia plantaginis]